MKMPGDRTVEDKPLYIYERQSEKLAYIDLSNSTTYHGNAVQSHFSPSWTLSIQNIRRSPHLKIVAHLLLQNLCVAYSSSYLPARRHFDGRDADTYSHSLEQVVRPLYNI